MVQQAQLTAPPRSQLRALPPHQPPTTQSPSRHGAGEYRPGAVIYEEGSQSHALYVLLSGRVRLTARVGNAPPMVTGLLRPGDLFGLDTLIGAPPSDTATAESLCRVQTLDEQTLDRLIVSQHGFAARIMEALVRRRTAVEHLLTRALMTGVPGRLAGALLDAAERHVVSGQTRQQLAETAWTTRETATRVLFQFAAAGLVCIDGRRIELLDEERLRGLATGDRRQPAA